MAAKWTVPCHQTTISKPTIPWSVPQTISGVTLYLLKVYHEHSVYQNMEEKGGMGEGRMGRMETHCSKIAPKVWGMNRGLW